MDYILKPTGLSVEELRGHQGGVKAKHLVFGTERSYEREGFATPTGKAEFVSTVLEKYKDAYGYDGLPVYRDFREVSEVDRTVYPWILNTGSRKPQYFHARVNRLPWLAALEPATLVEMHPSDITSDSGRRPSNSDFARRKHGRNCGSRQKQSAGDGTYLPWKQEGRSE